MPNDNIFSEARWPDIRTLAVEALGVKADTVRKWRKNGVPGKWHLSLLHVAKVRGVALKEVELRSETNRRNGTGEGIGQSHS
ncbi:MAG: hypothetical protein ACR2PM_00395 [Hyphomicrobiales bacterium]